VNICFTRFTVYNKEEKFVTVPEFDNLQSCNVFVFWVIPDFYDRNPLLNADTSDHVCSLSLLCLLLLVLGEKQVNSFIPPNW
jgi:hypothetical protein